MGVQVPPFAPKVYGKFLNLVDAERRSFKMKPVTILGIVLILLGIVGFALGGISFTHEKKVVDMGPVQISHQQTKTVPIPPVLSAIALVGGIGLAVIGTRSK
ncbi:MAG: YidH family protein [Acidobacteriaceae bacterium]